MKENEHLSEAEIDIFMCRLSAALQEDNIEKIKQIQNEIRERLKMVAEE